jgi:GDPmannose 4,6-dehydratase
MTRALITGMAGFVGSHLAEYLLAKTDWEIYGLLRWQEPLDSLAGVIPLVNEGKRVHLVYGDLHDALSIRDAVDAAEPDYVFHLAAQSYPKTSFTAPLDTLDTNVQGTVRLLDALRRHDALIHVCSSSEVYGKVDKKHLPITEDCPFHPASPYAISKVGADLVARFYAEAYGMKILVTRMFTHTGPRRGDVFAESTFAKQIAMAEAGQIEPVIKVGNLNSVRTVADVRDAVRAYHMLLTINPQPGEVYNIGGTVTCTVEDMLSKLRGLSLLSFRTEVEQSRLRPIDADLQLPDCTKFKTHTGWEPEIPFEQTMADLLDYWRGRTRRGPCLTR